MSQANGARVLVVDDEPALRKSIARVLGDEHVVEAVASVGDALERLRSGAQFDVILSDVMMPGESGLDLREILLRELPSYADRLVFMSGGVRESLQDRLAEVKNVCLDKPLSVERLRAVIRQTVALSRRSDTEEPIE